MGCKQIEEPVAGILCLSKMSGMLGQPLTTPNSPKDNIARISHMVILTKAIEISPALEKFKSTKVKVPYKLCHFRIHRLLKTKGSINCWSRPDLPSNKLFLMRH